MKEKQTHFITVKTYSGVNLKGKELNAYVERKYHHTLALDSQFGAILSDIRAKMAELEKKHPRTAPLGLEVMPINTIDGVTFHIEAFPKNARGMAYVFIMTTDVVRQPEPAETEDPRQTHIDFTEGKEVQP